MDLLDDLFWNYQWWQQRSEINELKDQAQAARTRLDLNSRDHRTRVEALEQQLGELALLTRALLEVLHENGSVKNEQILAAMAKIDAEDGVVDGRVTPEKDRPKTPAKGEKLPPRKKRPDAK
jgi:hypothetical protein